MNEKNDLQLLFQYRGALMGIAALWILVTHEWQIVSFEGEWIYEIERFWKRIGFCGVDIFMILSGMGMVFSLEKNSIIRFYYNRIKRIIIPFWFMASVVAFIDKWDKVFYFKVITGIAFFRINIYSFLWFVPAIITFYILVPIFYAVFKRAKNKYIFRLAVLEIWLLVSLLLKAYMREDLYGFTNRIPIFIMGVFLGWICREKTVHFNKTTWIFLIITLILGLYLAYQSNMNGMQLILPVSNCCIPNFLIAVSLPLLIAKVMDMLCTVKLIKYADIILIKIFSFFGMISLEFYCVQEWIAKKILPEMVQHADNLLVNLELLIIVSVCGMVLYLINKSIVKGFDFIDTHFINVN